MDATQQHNDGDERRAGDALVGAKQIAEFITSLGVPTDEDDVYYARRANKLPIGKYGAELIASKTKLTRHVDKITRKPPSRPERDEISTSDAFQSAQPSSGCAIGKSEKPNNDGLLCGCAVEKGESRQSEHAEGSNGLAPGLSQRTIAELADDYTETTYRLNQAGSDIDSAALDADLRRRLAEMVLPEFVEVEFERVMAEVFRV